MHVLGHRHGKALFCGRARLGAPHVMGYRRSPLVIGDLFVVYGTVDVECEAVTAGAAYEIGPSGWSWSSHDGTRSAVNITAFEGGGLVPSGAGEGTTITRVLNVDPLPTTIEMLGEE